MKVTADTMYDCLLLFIGGVVGIIATIFILNYVKIEPLKIEKKRVMAVHDVITDASFLCGVWKVSEKTFDAKGNLKSLTLIANGVENLLKIPPDLDPELLCAWDKKKVGESMEIIISVWRIKQYLQKGGKSPRPIDLLEPDSINGI